MIKSTQFIVIIAIYIVTFLSINSSFDKETRKLSHDLLNSFFPYQSLDPKVELMSYESFPTAKVQSYLIKSYKNVYFFSYDTELAEKHKKLKIINFPRDFQVGQPTSG